MISSAVELWHSLVDAFANISDGVHRIWILERVSYPDFEENKEVNALLGALSEPQREILTKMMIDARHEGVFDTLALFHDRLALNDGKYLEHGVEMAFEPHGHTLYQDYLSRKMRYEWPSIETPNKSPERTRAR
jgi:hypothetical protein